ncbi:hypothetical protein GOODEAATRI_013305, partial [Goodea atripinnis]
LCCSKEDRNKGQPDDAGKVKNQTDSTKLTIKVYRVNVLEEHPSFHRVHLLTDTHGARTEVHVHHVQCVGHGIHSVNDKLHLTLLFVLRVPTDSFVA